MRSSHLRRLAAVATFLLLVPRFAAAQSDSTADYVLLANRLIKFTRLNLVASGNVGVDANDGLIIAQSQLVTGEGVHVVANDISIKGPASLFSLLANHVSVHGRIDIRATGQAQSYPPPILNAFPSSAAMLPGSVAVSLRVRETVTLPPGSYGTVKLSARSTLVLTGGNYTFSSLKTAALSRLLFTSPTVVNIVGNVKVGSRCLIGPIGPGVYAQDILIHVAGNRVRLSRGVTMAAKLIAPDALVRVGRACLIKGQILADAIRLGLGTVAEAAQVPGLFEVRTATPTQTPTATNTAPTATPTLTNTPQPTDTPSSTTTATRTPTPEPSATGTATDTPIATDTPTPNPTETLGPPPTSTATATPSETPTATATETNTWTPTATHTATASVSPTATAKNTATETPTSTATSTPQFTTTATAVPPAATGTPCAGGLSLETSYVDQVAYVTQTLGGSVTQLGGTGDGNNLLTASDFIGPVTSSTGVTVSAPSYIFASRVIDYELSGNSEPGNLPQVVLGSPTDITFTAPGSGGPDMTEGDGSLVMGSAGNFVTVGFGTTLSATTCAPHALLLFTNTAGVGTAEIDLLSGGSIVASASTTISGGPAQSGLGGAIYSINDLSFDAVRITRTSGQVEIDAVAVLANIASDTGPGVICGDGEREGGEDCDDGNETDNDGCSAECRTEVHLMLGSEFCTLSQGGWGAPGGIGNGTQGFVTLYPEILPATIGGPSQSTTIHSQDALIAYLPSNGKPQALFLGERDFYGADDVITDGGGVLSGQTIALTLATHLSDAMQQPDRFKSLILPRLPFCTQSVTAGADGMLGTSDDMPDSNAAISGPWALPSNVAAANHTVSDLLVMANQYLRGADSASSIDEVKDSAETLNLAFDGCRRVVECQ